MTPDLFLTSYRHSAASREKKVQLKPVSFDDYYTLWRGIATSIHGYKENNNCKNFKYRQRNLECMSPLFCQ